MNIVLVLRTGRNFGVRDVELLSRKIIKTTPGVKIICLSDTLITLPGVEYQPLCNDWKKWWCRMELYSPRLLDYRPFLFIDLDTIVLGDLNELIDLIPDKNMYIPLEDFYQKGKLATGFLWMPKDNPKVNRVWIEWFKAGCPDTVTRMDYFLRTHIIPDTYWQRLTNKIVDFKPIRKPLLKDPGDAIAVCLHGKPSVWEADVEWVKKYRNE